MSSLCAPVGVGQPAGNCPQLNGGSVNDFLVGINNKFFALDQAQCPDPSEGCPQPYTLAQLFSLAGMSQQDITCYLSLQPCWNPSIIEYFNSIGIDGNTGLPISSPTPLGTNYAPPATNATSAYVSGSQVIATQTGQPVTSAAAPPPATSTSATSACAFALFGETSCIGPVGTTTALVIGGALLALFLLMGGKR